MRLVCDRMPSHGSAREILLRCQPSKYRWRRAGLGAREPQNHERYPDVVGSPTIPESAVQVPGGRPVHSGAAGGPTNLLFARAHKSLSAEQRETRLSLTPYELRWVQAVYLQRCKASGAALTNCASQICSRWTFCVIQRPCGPVRSFGSANAT
jgi:hypothetical protein